MALFRYRIAIALFLTIRAVAATLVGKVTDALTGQPMADVRIQVGNGSKPTSVTSDAGGVYTFQDETATMVSLMVTHPGYAPLFTALWLKPGESATRNLELWRSGSISGKLTDRETGKPVGKMTIRLDSANFRTELTTSAAGEFNAPRLPPGKYSVQILPKPREYDKEKPGNEGYGMAYYPGVPRSDMAVPILLASGEDRFLDWHVKKEQLYSVTGIVDSEQGVELYLMEDESLLVHGYLPQGGPFHIEGLAPGSWHLLFRTTNAEVEDRSFAKLSVQITERDVADVRVVLLPGSVLAGSLSIPEAVTPEVTLALEPVRLDPGFVRAYLIDNKLAVMAVPPGKYWPRVTGLRPGYAVTGLSISGRETELYSEIELAGSSRLDLAFRLTGKPACLSGYLRDSNGKSFAIRVGLVPDRLPLNADPRSRRFTEVGTDGAFRFTDLAPGRYRVAALAGSGEDTERLASGEVFEVGEGEAKQITLKP